MGEDVRAFAEQFIAGKGRITHVADERGWASEYPPLLSLGLHRELRELAGRDLGVY